MIIKNFLLYIAIFSIPYSTSILSKTPAIIELNKGNQYEYKSAIVKDGNIYVVYHNGKQKQLTFNGSDEKPILIAEKNFIVFVRDVQEIGINHKYIRKKLMSVSIDDMNELLITEKKLYKDGNDQSYEIFNIDNPTLSLDRKSIYFTTEKWVTANQLVKVHIEGGRWQELFSANNFTLIKKGSNRGNFLIAKSEIRDKGRAIYYSLVDENGKVKKEFLNHRMAEQFLTSVQ